MYHSPEIKMSRVRSVRSAPQLLLIALRTFAHKVPLRDERFGRIGPSGSRYTSRDMNDATVITLIYQSEQERNPESYVRYARSLGKSSATVSHDVGTPETRHGIKRKIVS